ncbi:MAG: sterol desaturase family protein [Betaproteobacteria bacterium]|nr:MAG: sterol desaturase family protein [Betaproteobacteria bacterium]
METIAQTTHYVFFNLTKALLAFLQRDSFLYWPFLVSSVLIALVAWRIAAAVTGSGSWRQFFRDYFGGAVWWHRSARADYRFYVVNALVLPVAFGTLLLGERQIAGMIDALLGLEIPIVRAEPASFAMRLAFTVAFFIAYDFGRFVAHSLLHDVPLLWEFHKVHHSAEVLTPMTSYRAHPVDLLMMAWGSVVMTGLVTWVFNHASGGAIHFYSFLGVHALLWVANLIGNLRHSPVWLSYGPGVGRWLISPAHHQLHHSCEPRHLGCNRGFELAVWDRLYGTLYVPPVKAEAFRMGLGDPSDGRWNSLARMYLWPFAGAARRLRKLGSEFTWRGS